jgi:nucleoside-diphosphate-sugar epimerase
MRILITGGNGNIATIIKNGLKDYIIDAPTRQELDVMSYDSIKNYLDTHNYINNDINNNIIIHTAIKGGRRTKEESYDVVYTNLYMFENLVKFINRFKMFINLDSAAIYDRTQDIYCRKENEIYNVPSDYYGFSKYLIYQRSLQYDSIYNFRLFNIFHPNEENDRFIKACFLAKKSNNNITINADKYFDFVSSEDFIKILIYYISSNQNNINKNKLEKTINICYKEKYKLSEIANMILNNNTSTISQNIIILNQYMSQSTHSLNYCGDNSLIKDIKLDGLISSLQKYNI